MEELKSNYLPFQDTGVVIRETRHRIVTGLDTGFVLKISKIKSDRTVFENTADAVAEIRENTDSRLKIASLLQSIGADKRMVIPVETVIHAPPSGLGITYTEVQRWSIDSKPLAKLKWGLVNLPIPTLEAIRNLFIVNKKLLRSEKTCFELDGSSKPTPPKILEKILQNLFPLFYSHNVIIDINQKPQLIDVESMEKFSQYTRNGLSGWARRQIKAAGFNISIAVLSFILAIKHLKKKTNQDVT